LGRRVLAGQFWESVSRITTGDPILAASIFLWIPWGTEYWVKIHTVKESGFILAAKIDPNSWPRDSWAHIRSVKYLWVKYFPDGPTKSCPTKFKRIKHTACERTLFGIFEWVKNYFCRYQKFLRSHYRSVTRIHFEDRLLFWTYPLPVHALRFVRQHVDSKEFSPL